MFKLYSGLKINVEKTQAKYIRTLITCGKFPCGPFFIKILMQREYLSICLSCICDLIGHLQFCWFRMFLNLVQTYSQSLSTCKIIIRAAPTQCSLMLWGGGGGLITPKLESICTLQYFVPTQCYVFVCWMVPKFFFLWHVRIWLQLYFEP